MKLPIYTAAIGVAVSLLVVGGIFAIRPRKSVSRTVAPKSRPVLSEYQQKRYNQALFDATEANNLTKVKWCVRVGADVNDHKDEYDAITPLVNAAFNKNLEMCQFLANSGADPDGRNIRFSPLHQAVENDNLEAVRVLLKVGANPSVGGDPDVANASGSPLDLAAYQGKIDILKLFLARMTSLSAAEKQEYLQEATDSMLNHAISSGTLSEIQQLVAKGAEFDFEDGLQLKFAVARVSVPIVNYLLAHGASANQRTEVLDNFDGQTALMESVHRGSTPILNILLKHQAKVNLQDGKGRTALMYTGLCDMYFDRLMPPSLDYATKEELEQRKRRLNGDATRILIKHGANVNLRDKSGMTALMYAAQGNGEATETLLSYHAQIKTRDTKGHTALHYAAMARDFRSLRALLRHGARVNARNNEGATPLMLATVWPEDSSSAKQRNIRLKCLSILRRYGANPHLKDKVGDTAKDYSQWEDGYDITAS